MPSRADTLQWLGDDVTSLSDKVSDILKLDGSISASAPIREEQKVHPAVVFSDSFSPGQGGLPSDADTPRPEVNVDAVSDAVGNLSVALASDAVADAVISPVAETLAEPAALDASVNGAVGGGYSRSVISMLAQFTDDTVHTPWAIKNVPLYLCPCLRQLLTDFQSSSTGTLCGQFAIM